MQAQRHLDEQGENGLAVPLLKLQRDADAPRDAQGVPHANLSVVTADAGLYAGWSTSARLLDEQLVAAAAAQGKDVALWVVDDAPTLQRAWRLGVGSVVTNRPKWALLTLGRWAAEACARTEVRACVRRRAASLSRRAPR